MNRPDAQTETIWKGCLSLSFPAPCQAVLAHKEVGVRLDLQPLVVEIASKQTIRLIHGCARGTQLARSTSSTRRAQR